MLTIYYHRDYDGLVAAAILSVIMKERKLYNKFNYIPIDYEQKNNWQNLQLIRPSAIVDFLYHNDADYYFDHHITSFSGLPIKRVGRKMEDFRWDPTFKSTPSLLLDTFNGMNILNKYSELIKWSDIIDSAEYSCPSELYDYSKKHILLNKVIIYFRSNNMDHELTNIIPFVIENKISEYLNNYTSLIENIIAQENKIFLRLKGKMTITDTLCIFDQTDEDIEYQRYLSYNYYPNIEYTIGIYKRGEKYALSVGYNPWKNENKINLGKLAEKYNGGGRNNVAGILVETHEDALKLANAISNEILELRIKLYS